MKTGLNVRRKQTHPFQAGYPSITYASLADFAANNMQSATMSDDGGPGEVFGWEYASYLQDNIKATHRLTFNLGLRYDYGSPFEGAAGTTLANFDLTTVSLVTQGPFYTPDRNDFAPRVSVAYDVRGDARTVLGAGYGMYYNPYPLQLFFGSTLFSNVQGSTTLNQTTNPGLRYPLPPGGVTPPPNRSAINPDRRDNYAHQFTVNLQRGLGANMSLQVGYVGTRTRNDMIDKPGNLIAPALGRRPLPQFAEFTITTEAGHSQYDALQIIFNRRLSKGLALHTTYTYSRYLDNKYAGGAGGPEIPCANDRDFASCPSIEAEWARSDLDTPHNLSVSAIWKLPLGQGRWREGWQLNGILLARSGLPYTVLLGTSRAGTGWFTNQRPNVVSGVSTAGDVQGPTGWLNPAAFSDVPTGQYGNLPRNSERGPRFLQIDMSLLKNIATRGSQRVQLRMEVFNVPNSPIWAIAPASTWLNPTSFGKILNTFGRTESFGTSRQIQLALRYDF